MDRVRIKTVGERLDKETRDGMSRGADPKGWLASYRLNQLYDLRRHLLPKGHSKAATKEAIVELLLDHVYAPEVVNVKLEVYWGKEWTGSYYAETEGRGVYFNVMETHPYGKGFAGCPLGRCHHSAEGAIDDFIMYGRPEYKGKKPLCREMIAVRTVVDHRRLVPGVAMPPKYALPVNARIVYTASGWEVYNHNQLLVSAVESIRVAINDTYAKYREQLGDLPNVGDESSK